ncbi:DUF397 domain-containing protein [Streptomyces sp. NBC_01808]|uniref:DUF397 domain-containing protein n=1 Tax=Streptomyces sp. NBC_01808 TaxID=2975947 RepID=UPI002DD98DB8|nr:DUF397 domain-containing protein [Streptomyces sp. NBC_01808]WSA37540.1 DUF397 domain-containing protein [Streptomyces sp. NBC_01808]
MDRTDLAGAHWYKSSYSNGQAECIEVAVADGVVAARDSKDPSGPVLTFAPDAWRAFVAAVRGGEYGR